ncbi:MAG: flagellar hook-associated protein FlgK [Desulfobacula sp.]|jgi:flagellar hook-associated protein FlgK|nr:flagellar hook-associated protein FlgK [Desulfobacula sp.]
MSGISSTLSIAKTAISAQQYGLNITGQNIANVNNPDYSVQDAEHKNNTPAAYGGFLFGTGVDMYQIRQSVDKLLEQRLTSELSTQASFEEQESYMRILEGFFDVSSETSITNVLTEFWNSWHDLSNNPEGSSERVAVLENGKKVASGFETAVLDMDALSLDITLDINAAIISVNALTSQIAELNQQIVGSEIGRTANDLRDQRNKLLDDLGDLIDISTYEQSDGSVTVNAANNFTIISGVDTYTLGMTNKEVVWESSSSGDTIISDKVQGGSIGGLLEMRDEVIPKYRAEIDELSREMIWAINYQHSQGAGLEYFSEPVTGNYATDDSGWLTSYEFGDKIDNSKDFTMWVEDKTTVDTQYTSINMDMSISQAGISNWQGMSPGAVQSIYKLTVVDEAVLGDKEITETDGDGLAQVHGLILTSGAATTVSMTLDSAIAEQTISVYSGPAGTGVIEVKDVGGDAKRSAASLVEALNEIGGVTAYASENSVTFDTTGIANAQDGDEIQFSFYVDGIIQDHAFIRDSSAGSVQEQFEDALLAVAEAVNNINEDNDLFANGLTITSSSGKTLGVQDFEVLDNAGVSFNDFSNFDAADTITFTIDSMAGTSAAGTTSVSIDLTDVDTSDQAQMALTFYDALTSSLAGEPFTIENDLSTNSVFIRTIDGSDIRVRDAGDDTGNNASITLAELGGTTADAGNTDSILDFTAAANDTARYNATTSSGDDLIFSGQGTQVTINESTAGAVNKTGVITGTVTIMLDPGMAIRTTVSGAGSGGLFDSSYAKVGSSILTLGGDGGFSGFTDSIAANETISFRLDGTDISFLTTAGVDTSDLELARLFESEIDAALGSSYQVIRTGSSVSIIKDAASDDPIVIENFSDTYGNNDTYATLQVRTGTGTGINQSENDILDADPAKTYRSSSTSSLYDDEGIIMWERLDEDGARTGATGLIHVEDEGSVAIVEDGFQTMTFDISKGSLVAGNTLTINTDTSGSPDPLDFRITGRANSINDIYQFTVVSGGKVGHLPGSDEEPLVIEWSNSVGAGTFTIEGNNPPYTPGAPVEVVVDGMNLKFYDGTVFSGDVFTITTGDTGVPVSLNSDGQPTGEKLSDWHWTIDSFAEQFNRVAPGMKASTTIDNRLKFEASETYYVMENIQYSGTNGFDEENISISMTDWSAIDFKAADLRFEHSSTGVWGVLNDPTGSALQIIPLGGDDNGFGVDFSGDGLADIQIDFQEKVSGNGYVEFDFNPRNAQDIGFAFSDDLSTSAGLVAAAGINTFFNGYDSMTMEVNEELNDTRLIAAASLDSETGLISQGDNTNALAMADIQYHDMEMILWTYKRGVEAQSSAANSTLDDYYTRMISSLGIQSQSIKNSKGFADIMVNNITEQRNSISAVSLDEEMIKLMQYQHAYSAAAKLLTVSDEMLNTLISMR